MAPALARPACLLLALVCAFAADLAQAAGPSGGGGGGGGGDRGDGAPGVYLEQANVPRAKALALDAALIKGWQVAASGSDYSIFETMVHESGARESGGGPKSVLLRIRADFSRDAGGVRVSLVATEISAPGTSRESQRDVTDDYRVNLYNALASLRQQWDDFALAGRPSRQPPDRNRSDADSRTAPAGQSAGSTAGQSTRPAARPVIPDPPPPPPPAGQWSYEAEKLAARHGCKVASSGAILLGGRADSQETGHEVHRVSCDNRSALLVRCDSEGCSVAR
ncbi:hypothetical protein Thiosp_03034 [Thiorhodovibrio litoralis]|nr:hypothetical protein Thiosp_03034 [Thiorhodovibrio litoralis]